MADIRIVPVSAATSTVAPVKFPELKTDKAVFGQVLGRAVQEVNGQAVAAQEAAVSLASGQSKDTAQALTSIEKANITFQFALQIRNKLLDAYTEVMRMSV
jgi:flagellar hook-basal body complex protein FliE